MQNRVREWARDQGETLYLDEAKLIFAGALQSILRRLEMMSAKIAPLCADPAGTKNLIDEHIDKIRKSIVENLNEKT